MRLPARPASVPAARRFIVDALRSWGAPEVADVVRLLASEIVTNAIVHARTNVVVIIVVTPPIVRVEVSDDAERYPEMRRADEEATSGRGMTLVDALASAWGVQPANGGKCVWFEVAA